MNRSRTIREPFGAGNYLRFVAGPILWATMTAVCVPGFAAEKEKPAPDTPFPPSLEPLRPSLEQSVKRGVAWLAGAQNPDGTMPERWGNNTGIVGLCGQAMLSAGMTPDHPVYGPHVVRYLEFILKSQNPDGLFWLEGTDTVKDSAFMYAHPMATTFVAECSGMVDEKLQEKIDAALPKAIGSILRAQEGGGSWRYHPRHPRKADLSVSSWNLLALRVARKNGATVPKEAIDRGVQFVLACRDVGRVRFTYFPGWGHTNQMTACGLLCLMLAGRHDDPDNKAFADFLVSLAQPDGWVTWTDFWNMPGRNEYTLYHTTMAIHQFGGSHWDSFAQKIIPGIIGRQDPKDGSWNGNIGRPYSTAMHVICLSAPLCQAPMHQR